LQENPAENPSGEGASMSVMERKNEQKIRDKRKKKARKNKFLG